MRQIEFELMPLLPQTVPIDAKELYFSKVSAGDRVVCRGNCLVASSLFGIVLKNNEVIEVK